VILAMQKQTVAQFMAVAPARFRGSDCPVALVIVHYRFQAGHHIILGVHCQNKSEDDAISFLTGHVIHPVSGLWDA
jgi:hypothetical protein